MSRDLLEKIRAAGVVGAGGAGFPTHVKLDATAETVILNGMECEPLLRVDQQLLAVYPEEILGALAAIRELTSARRVVVALKKKYRAAVEALRPRLTRHGAEMVTLGSFYPAGDEHVLVREVTGLVVPEGGIPLQVGTVVVNAETALNVARALDGQPVLETYVTVTGEVPAPVTVKAPLGTSTGFLVEAAGGHPAADLVVVQGGPMMGTVGGDWQQPVSKTTKGLIVLPAGHGLVRVRTLSMEAASRQARSACIQCMMCTEMCPRYLLGHALRPHLIMRGLAYQPGNTEAFAAVFLCSECGVCELICPAGLSPRRVNAFYKRLLTGQGRRGGPGGYPAGGTRSGLEGRRLPVERVVARLGLEPYDRPAPLRKELPPSARVDIPLKQHTGVPAQPEVREGDWVERGQRIAAVADGALGAHVHASLSGKVVKVGAAITVVAG